MDRCRLYRIRMIFSMRVNLFGEKLYERKSWHEMEHWLFEQIRVRREELDLL